MPLHVNLYHEVQRQERARRRDPVRLGILALLFISIGFAVNYFVALAGSHSVGLRYSTYQAEFAKLDPKAKAAKTRQAELNDEIAASDTMMKNVDSRFYWAPVFDQILKTVPRNVQLVHVGADAPSTPGEPRVLTITGISSAVEPRKEAEALRTALDTRLRTQCKSITSQFKALDDSDQVAVLDGRRLATATFTIEFQLQVADSAPTPAPLPIRKPKFALSE